MTMPATGCGVQATDLIAESSPQVFPNIISKHFHKFYNLKFLNPLGARQFFESRFLIV